MSLNWNEKTLNAFFENTRKTILNLDRRIKEVNERTKTSFEVSEDAIRGIVEKYVGDGDDTLSKNMSKFEQTADAIRTEVRKVQQGADGQIKELTSKIEQIGGRITLEVTDGSETGTASIVLKVDGQEVGRGTIDLSGLVIFNSFLNDSKTMIDGGKIETDTLFARDIKATGSFQVNNGVYAIEQNTNGVVLKNVQDDSTQVSSVTLSNGAMDLKSLLITLMAKYRGQTGKIVVDYGAVSILATSDGNWTDAYSYGIDVNDLGINMTHCPSITEDTLFSNSDDGLSITAGAWKTLVSISLPAGTYIIRGTLTVYHSSAYYITSIKHGSTEIVSSRNTTQCNGGDMYAFGQSVAFVKLTSTTTVSLTVYGSEDSSYSQNAAYIEALKIYN